MARTPSQAMNQVKAAVYDMIRSNLGRVPYKDAVQEVCTRLQLRYRAADGMVRRVLEGDSALQLSEDGRIFSYDN